MVRENNQKYINTFQTEETPKFGAGSAFGKDAKVGVLASYGGIDLGLWYEIIVLKSTSKAEIWNVS